MGRQLQAAIEAPYKSLIALFCTWELLLLSIALLSPGPGYDTSTQLLLQGHGISNIELPLREAIAYGSSPIVDRALRKLTRWDAIYFASIAEKGYQLEQEWAFGWGFTRLLSFLATYIPITNSRLHDGMLHGIAVANVSHLLSVLVLYHVAFALPLGPKNRRPVFALVVAGLHVLSPAGIFLVAPFTESLFSLLNISGVLCYIYSWAKRDHGVLQDLCLLLCGACFALAATVRGNGVLGGAILLFDAVLWFALQVESRLSIRVLNIWVLPQALQLEVRSFSSRRLPATILAGIITGIGFVTPQFIAYQQYCNAVDSDIPVWCSSIPPSIYSYVQKHYWNVGFLRYWTVSNIPLFLLAAPMLCMMFYSSWIALTGRANAMSFTVTKIEKTQSTSVARSALRTDSILIRLALVEIALATLAFTSFHVQIINRISSGYPVWYLILARDVLDGKRQAKWMFRWIIMYALIQAVLFTAFLPPA